ncbi:phosphatidylinositol-bisphosphate-binding protein [Sporothrix brasiliensis 5110]|uniref:Phosphatidylinositol-bisphosphate-binding protein n=1 Tax=Sporothrix brasiliensis 5110 TaxID=1398154 RepID=A0A0C2JA03_9PEZI|nr:phosphatidylinositol-bisphosphate-binding protein [Sporothrix brasiliensis 5110]KIH93747.1 phosphatidylinositol-bisphosphate-binding protein [Sporothrix brasiliensis 5110]
MDARTPIEGSSNVIALAASFNLNCDCFVVGTNSGIRAKRPFKEGGVGLIQIVGRTNIIPLVGGGRVPVHNPLKVVVWDEKRQKFTREVPCERPIRGLHVLGQKLVVVLDEEVSIYNIDHQPVRVHSFTTTPNPAGLCAVSRTHFAILGQIPGHVKIVHNETHEVSIIPAHSSELAAIALSRDGSLLATASEKGTLIRVFLTANNGRVAELRRGVDQVSIFSLGFNPSGTLLACTSDKGTLHIFDIPHQTTSDGPGPAGGSRQSGGVPSDVGGEWAYEESDGGVSFSSDQRADPTRSGDSRSGRWGVLGKIPFMPKYFRDTVSFASAEFAMDDGPAANRIREADEASAMRRSRLPLGIIGWRNDNTVVVLGTGLEPKYERFVISTGNEGQRVCVRQAWANYLNMELS